MAFISKIATLLVLGVFSSSLLSAQGIEDTRKINTFGREVVEAEGQVTELSQSPCQDTDTPDLYQYQYVWPRVPAYVTQVTFRLRAHNDAHISLSADRKDLSDMFEIVIGGWGNTQSVIRLCKQCHNQVTVATPNILSTEEDREFYVSFADGVIDVGLLGESPFMSYRHDKAWPINYIGLSTGWGSEGSWEFCGYLGHGTCMNTNTPDLYKYQYVWPRVPAHVTRVTFRLRAHNDAHVSLSADRKDVSNMFEIVIGGWGNTQSVIRLCKQCHNQVTIATPNILSTEEDREFYVSFADGEIDVGLVGESPFMSYRHDNSWPINYIGLSTGWGSEGSFEFCGYLGHDTISRPNEEPGIKFVNSFPSDSD